MYFKQLEACAACPRACKVNRNNGELGYCGCSNALYCARAALHYGEEPPISGTHGSGTVFFTGCTLRCVYCQNACVSSGKVGKEISVSRLAHIFLELAALGAHNINLVTPTQYVYHICAAISQARKAGLDLPIIYNTSGYERQEIIAEIAPYVDIFLTDFKYASSSLAKAYSFASDYPACAVAALDAMYAAVGPCVFSDADISEKKETFHEEPRLLKRGVIVRHLLLPGQLSDSKKILDILAKKSYIDKIWLSLMSQYTPNSSLAKSYPELNRKVSQDAYDELLDYSLELGIENCFMQDTTSADESFIPAFDFSGL